MRPEALLEELAHPLHAASTSVVVEGFQDLEQRSRSQSQRRLEPSKPGLRGTGLSYFPAPDLLTATVHLVSKLLLSKTCCLPERAEPCSEVRGQAVAQARPYAHTDLILGDMSSTPIMTVSRQRWDVDGT